MDNVLDHAAKATQEFLQTDKSQLFSGHFGQKSTFTTSKDKNEDGKTHKQAATEGGSIKNLTSPVS